jgi:hypothetical protein
LIPSAAFLTVYFLSQLKYLARNIFTIVLLITLIFNVLPYLKIQGYLPQDEGLYATNEDTTTVKNEYMPTWVIKDPTGHFSNKAEIVEGTGSLMNIKANSKNISLEAVLTSNAKIRVNTLYYPGWKAYIDGKETAISYNNLYGVMDISVPKNIQLVTLNFTETPLRLFADVVSILSFVLLLIFTFNPRLNFLLNIRKKSTKSGD